MTDGFTLADRIVALLGHFPDGLTDAQIASQLRVVHDQVNSRCRTLADAGILHRDDFGRPIMNSLVTELPRAGIRTNPAHEWYWEGNVLAELVRYFEMDGWVFLRGDRIMAQRAGRLLHVESKGFPTKRSTSDSKPPHPMEQAEAWFADSLLKALRLRQDCPDDVVGIGLPDFVCYRELVADTADALRAMRIDVFLVRAGGRVDRVDDH
ncbi:hypothetical protein [Umezawaea sp. Da 62-37]|uniref:hypothetical protein n=1 Tax=Umezawaea sp. Da 62-37 TaxID=3075927 RepID=UPI0028F6F037|nr:hypothetical protein [Umezawaea sp. Da 62-37]WNV83765.1 hypothetical protein RM788_37145 [Umezawaea sp. Da 62-37]